MRAQCCICADLFVNGTEVNIAATTCGHVFHEHCLARWLLTAKTCPSCRKVVNNSAIIPKLYFDVADDDDVNQADPDQLTNELQTLKSSLAELRQEKRASEAKVQELKDQVGQRNEELEAVRAVLQQEQDRAAAQQRMLQQYEAQERVHKEQKAEFLRAQRKLTELKHIETILSGDSKECEDILQQYIGSRSGNPGQQQMAKYMSILKKEYEQVKGEKRHLKEQLDQLKSWRHSNTQDVAELRQQNQGLQEHLARSEDDLKQAEKMITSLKAKLHKLKYSRSRHEGQSAGSFSETPELQETSHFAFPRTPKLPASAAVSDETPMIRWSRGSNVVGSSLDQSFDLFEESPRTRVRKACEENNLRVVKISCAATSCKRAKVEAEEVASHVPLTALNIMKKREKTGQLMNTTVIRKDYDGLGGTSNFTQPLGLPRFSSCLNKNNRQKKIRHKRVLLNPSLPTLDAYIDLTE